MTACLECLTRVRERLTEGRGHSLNVDVSLTDVLAIIDEEAGIERPVQHGIGVHPEEHRS